MSDPVIDTIRQSIDRATPDIDKDQLSRTNIVTLGLIQSLSGACFALEDERLIADIDYRTAWIAEARRITAELLGKLS
ncbi:MAG: hypothetical protein M3N43_03020 [Actinomycetota bacterium]|nr:hypothetical protein [Actinomycetota bacterium]